MRLLLAAVLVVSLAACSRGPDLPPGAYKNDQFKFAVVPPSGWVVATPQNADTILTTWGDRMPDTFRERLMQPVTGRTEFVLAYLKTEGPDAYLPHIGVVHNSVGLPQVTTVELDKSRAMLKSKFTSSWLEALEESADIVEVDGRKAIKVVYSGSVASRLHSDLKTSKTHRIKWVELMVPSKDRTHFLSLAAEQEQFDQHLATFNAVVSSFRSFGAR
jgi:hypothetical protein